MDEQNQPRDRSAAPAAEQGAAEQASAGELARVTRQLPATPERKPAAQAAAAAQRERVASLISALGDPSHPLHQRSGEDLIAIGPACVSQLCEALAPQRPWLTAYRAAEALGRIGDGRAAGPLLEALRHQNSNVRWSAVRALATVGDARALLELRRVARADQGRTSWGESVSGAAQSVLDQMQERNVLLRGADLIKTAVACVFMLVALILAWSFTTALREEVRSIGLTAGEQEDLAPIVRTAVPTVPIPTPPPQPTLAPLQPTLAPLQPTLAPPSGGALTAQVVASGNVRSQPSRAANNVVGSVTEGDSVFVLSSTADKQWFRILLGQPRAGSSQINSADGTGWVARSLLSPVSGDIPVEEPPPPTPAPAATEQPAAPTAEPELPTPTPAP